jgi:hypothetical protein
MTERKVHVEETNSIIYGSEILDKDLTSKTKEFGIGVKLKLRYPTIRDNALIRSKAKSLVPEDESYLRIIYEMIVSFKYLDEGTKVWNIETGNLIDNYFSLDGFSDFNVVSIVLDEYTKWVDKYYTDNLGIDKVQGGIKGIVKEGYAKNLWLIMDKFNVLPTDPRFTNLTDYQITFLLESMADDVRSANEANSKEGDTTSYTDETGELNGEDWTSTELTMDSEEEEKSTQEQLESMLSGTEYKEKYDNTSVEETEEDISEEEYKKRAQLKARDEALSSLGLGDDKPFSYFGNNDVDGKEDDEEEWAEL